MEGRFRRISPHFTAVEAAAIGKLDARFVVLWTFRGRIYLFGMRTTRLVNSHSSLQDTKSNRPAEMHEAAQRRIIDLIPYVFDEFLS